MIFSLHSSPSSSAAASSGSLGADPMPKRGLRRWTCQRRSHSARSCSRSASSSSSMPASRSGWNWILRAAAASVWPWKRARGVLKPPLKKGKRDGVAAAAAGMIARLGGVSSAPSPDRLLFFLKFIIRTAGKSQLEILISGKEGFL